MASSSTVDSSISGPSAVDLSSRDLQKLTDGLCDALLTARTRDEMRRLLLDLCTPAEIRSIAERWHVAMLLDETNLSYREISDRTGVSTTTIVRVGRFLRQEPHQGYRRAINQLRGSSAK
ncbi:MAG TPA: YerC/YecD family TrpR-related protein [Sphingomicrobium sp.]|nr:YerC/YecD family TrpR-related protein [Sphingomicrobium sp.]